MTITRKVQREEGQYKAKQNDYSPCYFSTVRMGTYSQDIHSGCGSEGLSDEPSWHRTISIVDQLIGLSETNKVAD